jgi:hypothetical protein
MYDVRAEPLVSEDIRNLEDERLQRVAIELMGELRNDPWIGGDMRERYNMKILAGCRRFGFDLPDWDKANRYRIVYRNEPTDGAPALVRIWSVGPREDLVAYARAASRISKEQARTRRKQR